MPQRQLPLGDEPFPVPPQTWHFRQSIDYSMTANRAMLDLASKYREDFLFNIYQMGRNSIQRGSHDSWTVTPKRIEALKETAAKQNESSVPAKEGQRRAATGGEPAAPANESPAVAMERSAGAVPAKLYGSELHNPAQRDPRGYIVPSDQPDFPTATKFINTLIKTGITIQRATSGFEVAGKHYPAGSWVVKTAQAFRPHILDMFEPQDHPNDFRYPGGPPIPPYDVTGYTLAFQMGVKFDRILEPFDGPFEKVSGLQQAPAAKILGSGKVGYLIDHQQNDAFILVNRLLKNGDEVYWLKQPLAISGRDVGAGTMFVPAREQTAGVVQKAASELGVTVQAVDHRPAGAAYKLKPVRIGLWDQYGGSMTSGWLRWIFEQFEFPFEVVYPSTLDQDDLSSRFEVLVFPSGAIGRQLTAFNRQPNADDIPEEYRKMLGRVTSETTVPQLRKFVEAGGTIVTIGDATGLAQFLGLPLANGLVERTADGKEHPLPREKFYVPGSVMQVSVDNTSPMAYGMPPVADVFFENSPVFRGAGRHPWCMTLKGESCFGIMAPNACMAGCVKKRAGRHVAGLVYPDLEKFQEVSRLVLTQGEWTGELHQIAKERRDIIVEARCTLIRDKDGNPKSILAINTDVTEKKKVEAQFMRAQRMESIGTLAGGIAHDLNNILTPIMMSIDVLKAMPEKPKAMIILEAIGVSAKRGGDIVRQLLSFARGVGGQRIEVEPAGLLRDLESIITNTFPKNIQLNFSASDDVLPILGDPTQIQQVLLNLCVNGRDAMANGGNLTINVENFVPSERFIAMYKEATRGPYVTIKVSDTGTGIPASLREEIFKPFFTTKDLNKGTGLGLSTVLAIVKSHGGIVDLHTLPGSGTTFELYLPAAAGSSDNKNKTETPEISQASGNGERILVVDDEDTILLLTRLILENVGYKVLTATDGADGLGL